MGSRLPPPMLASKARAAPRGEELTKMRAQPVKHATPVLQTQVEGCSRREQSSSGRSLETSIEIDDLRKIAAATMDGS
jgi:hypothetical protein